MFHRENRKKKIEKRGFGFEVYFYILCSMFFSLSTNAQCAMCRAALTSEGNAVKAEAVNDGIVYLMVIPYILVGLVCLAVYKMCQKKIKV